MKPDEIWPWVLDSYCLVEGHFGGGGSRLVVILNFVVHGTIDMSSFRTSWWSVRFIVEPESTRAETG